MKKSPLLNWSVIVFKLSIVNSSSFISMWWVNYTLLWSPVRSHILYDYFTVLEELCYNTFTRFYCFSHLYKVSFYYFWCASPRFEAPVVQLKLQWMGYCHVQTPEMDQSEIFMSHTKHRWETFESHILMVFHRKKILTLQLSVGGYVIMNHPQGLVIRYIWSSHCKGSHLITQFKYHDMSSHYTVLERVIELDF